MNNLFVYCEIEEGIIADVSLELLTKGRSLANELNCALEAVVVGSTLPLYFSSTHFCPRKSV